MTKRITIQLSDDVHQLLCELAELDGVSLVEILRRGIRAEQFVVQTRIAGERILVQDPKTRHVREVIVW